jgi:hypothetical protein
MSRVKIKDLNIDLEELQKKDPKILQKIRGGFYRKPVPPIILRPTDSRWGTLCDTTDFGC